MLVERVLVSFFAVKVLLSLSWCTAAHHQHGPFVYTRDQLIALKPAGMDTRTANIPEELWRRTHRGCRGGTKQRTGKSRAKRRRLMEKKGYKPRLPTLIMGNVRSLANKMDELTALAMSQKEYRQCSLMCFSETWLHQDIPDDNVSITGFQTVRADRDCTESGKHKGGGLAVLVNNCWCSPGHITIKERICCLDIELLTVGLRPYYLPREFSHVVVVAVYIPASANPTSACGVIHSTIAPMSPNSTSDCLHCHISCSPLPPLGGSDHNLVNISSKYVPQVKSQPVTTRTVRRWSEETSEVLQDCFETTDWTALYEPHGEDIDGLTECITDYINFCVDSTVPTRTVKCYPNNKPWVTKDIKALLNKKKRAFRAGDREEVRTTQRELKRTIREAKDRYRRKLEWKLQQNNMREVWSGMRTITGFRSSNNRGVEGSVDRANDLNLFFNRFDTASSDLPLPDFSAAWPQQPTPLHPPPPPDSLPPSCDSPLHTSSPPPPVTSTVNLTADQVRRQLQRLNMNKAAGPDGVPPRVLKACATQLCGVLQHVFNMSLCLQRVPVMWKTSCIVPVPKTPRPSDIKDYRPSRTTGQWH
ncbi:hypothetical protein NFI96_014096 [Prochilodus magdalenae]|nr:hypothetical protein NFI96_014096 [Prochilodus magdalenae]